MARREPLKVRNWMLVYNVYQAILNVVMVYGLVKTALFDVADSDSPYWPIWGRRVDGGRSGWSLSFWLWVHYHNKFIEFFDTAFMVARKSTRQISFLHVYHHVLLVWAWLIVMRNAPGGDAYFGATMNSAVHVVMYTYYAMRCVQRAALVPGRALTTSFRAASSSFQCRGRRWSRRSSWFSSLSARPTRCTSSTWATTTTRAG